MIHQGHKYTYGPYPVIALETGDYMVRVSILDHEHHYPLRPGQYVNAGDLKPAPMRYFHGEIQ